MADAFVAHRVNRTSRRSIAGKAVVCVLVVTAGLVTGESPAQVRESPPVIQATIRVYNAVIQANTDTVRSLSGLRSCHPPRKQACLARQARIIVATADKDRRVVGAATATAPKRTCAYAAGTHYLSALASLRAGAVSLAAGHNAQAQTLLSRGNDGEYRAAQEALNCVKQVAG